jgi:ATP-binding cassette subfamily C (CFTR/MRP) protein 1
MFVLPMLGSLFAAQSNVYMTHLSIQFRNVLVNMIYRKSLTLSPAARQKSSTGQIVNMFSNDTQQLQRFLFFLNNVVVAPAQIAICLGLIYQQVGPATFVGKLILITPCRQISLLLSASFLCSTCFVVN